MSSEHHSVPEQGGSFKTEAHHAEQSVTDLESYEPKLAPDATYAGNLAYDDTEHEPEIHIRTWIAVASMFLLNFVQIIALQGPPVVVCRMAMLFAKATSAQHS